MALSSWTVIPNNLQARFTAEAKKVRADFEESAHTHHRGSRGTEREEILAKFLELYMPGTVEVVHNAEIITATGESSRQCDIVIVDKTTPKLRDIKSHRIIPVECVYGVIEVKSRLTSTAAAIRPVSCEAARRYWSGRRIDAFSSTSRAATLCSVSFRLRIAYTCGIRSVKASGRVAQPLSGRLWSTWCGGS